MFTRGAWKTNIPCPVLDFRGSVEAESKKGSGSDLSKRDKVMFIIIHNEGQPLSLRKWRGLQREPAGRDSLERLGNVEVLDAAVGAPWHSITQHLDFGWDITQGTGSQ